MPPRPDPTSRRSPLPLLVVGAGAVAALGLAAWLLLSEQEPGVEPPKPPVDMATPGPAPKVSELDSGAAASGPASDSVIFSEVAVWLAPEMVSGSDGSAAIGAGRTCSLSGRCFDERGGVRGVEVKITGGLNAGARAITNSDGQYELPLLYPGAAIVDFESPVHGRARRDVTIHDGQAEDFDFPLLQVGNVHGTVLDPKGAPIERARVELDGQTAETDKTGKFFFNGVIPGNVILYISADGHATRRATLNLRPGNYIETDRAVFRLEKSNPLVAQLGAPATGVPPPMLVVLPADPPSDFSIPWEKFVISSPRPGDEQVRIEGLPVERDLRASAFSTAGVPDPRTRPVLLRTGDTSAFSRPIFQFSWKRAVSGIVIADGKPLQGARVRIESTNIARAMDWALRDCGGLNRFAIPILPCARKQCESGYQGEFRIETSDMWTPAALVVEASGFDRAVLPVPEKGGDLGSVSLTRDPELGPATLSLKYELPSKRRLRLSVNGSPSEERTLDAGESITIPELAPGSYAIRVRENGFPVFERPSTRVRGTTHIAITGIPR